MRIDPNTSAQRAQDPGPATNSGSRAAEAAETAGGSAADAAQLSPDQVRVQALVAEIIALPEIRQDKVDALSRAVREGSHQVSSEQTAAAMLSEFSLEPVAAWGEDPLWRIYRPTGWSRSCRQLHLSGDRTVELSMADSTLNSLVTALQQAISLGVQGANGTLSDSDRADLSAELTGIQTRLVSLANVTYQGQYLFAGTATTQPFVADPTAQSGVRYAGNTGVNSVSIGPGYQLQINLPGSQIFHGPGVDVFQSLQDLITALNSNTGIPAAVNEVSSALNYVGAQRVFYGNGLSQTQSQQTYLSTEAQGLTEQANNISAADVASVATQLTQDQVAIDATLSSIGRTPATSLFDYLK